jgi:hypothetical protein
MISQDLIKVLLRANNALNSLRKAEEIESLMALEKELMNWLAVNQSEKEKE